jgi:capsular exopolysaccharide synthesis family protein
MEMESNRNKRDNVKNSGKEIDFQWFILSFLIHWKWFLLSIILFLLLGFFRLRYTTPVYVVHAKIILKDSKRGGLSNSELSVFESMGFLENSKNVENEMEILSSRNLLENVVIAQELFIKYIVKGHFKNTELYGDGNSNFYYSAPVKVFVDTTVITSLHTAIILNVSTEDSEVIHVVGNYGGQEFSGEYSALPAVIATPVGELLLLDDPNSKLRPEYPVEIQVVPPLWVAQQYMGMLNLSLTDNNTTVVRLSLSETIRKRGEDFLIRLIDLYNSDTMADKDRAANNASRFIDERLEDLKEELVLSEVDVQVYKQRNKIANINTETGLIIGERNEYEKKLIETGTKMLLLTMLEEEFNNSNVDLRQLPASLGGNLDAPSLTGSMDRYNQMVLERGRLLTYTEAESPIIKRLDERLTILRENIIVNLQTLRLTLKEQQTQYEKLKQLYDTGIEDVPRKERELADIVRQQLIKANLFVELLSRREEIALTLAVTAPSAKVLESPLSSGGPIAPQRMKMYMMCLLAGVISPFVIIGIRELFNYKISYEDTVRRFTEGVPVIVSLPLVKSKESLVITPHSTTAVAERFRLLRTNLQYVLNNPDRKVILVTSTISGEGKTFVSINLAVTFSLRYKTILVGLDIRRPKIGVYLNLPKKAGLISYLTGNESDLSQIINRNVAGTGLDVLVSGIVPPNPNELLMEKTLDDLFVQLRQMYDYVIVDTSPVGSVSDAFLVNRISDVSLYIVRGGFSPKSSMALINNIYDENRLNNVNIILNAFDSKKSGYGYGYGYGGYGYGYGYGYGSYGYTTE